MAAIAMMPLSMLAVGEEAEIVDVRGGYGFRSRLASLGLNPGMRVTMVQNLGAGPLLLRVLDSRLALGRGMTHKILVRKTLSSASKGG